jgi:hypothetical protein
MIEKTEDEYELMSVTEMRAKYGLTAANRPTVTLDAVKVPQGLRHLIPLAEHFGVSDDLIREDILKQTEPTVLLGLRSAVRQSQDLLEQWLAGPDASLANPSAEYIAFTCLQMAADGV